MVRFSIKIVNLCIGGKRFANLVTFKVGSSPYNRLSKDTCSWIVDHSLNLASAEKDSTDFILFGFVNCRH